MENGKYGYRKIVSIFLAGILACMTAVPALAKENGQKNNKKESEKSETVYVKAKADGTPEEITVSEWLKNTGDGDVLSDYSTLRDIKNIEGDEEFTQQSDGTLLWENHGEDISYEGKSDDELPVSVKISYYLNGKKMSPEQMAGQSGSVKIRFDYENHTSERVKVGDEKVKVKVPFVALSLLFLDPEVFSDVEVTNGKVIESENQSIAVGYACPGLAESLKLTEYEPTKEMDIPDYVEINADVTDFKLEFTATMVSSGLFEDVDEDDLKDADDLADSMEEMQDASGELLDGIGKLLDGTKEMGGYLDEYSEGVLAVNEGTRKLKEGMETLNSRKKDLEDGAAALQKGIESLNTALSQVSFPIDGSTSGAGNGSNSDGTGNINQVSGAMAALMKDGKALASGLEQLQSNLKQMEDFAAEAVEYQKVVESKAEEAKSKLDAVQLSAVEEKANERARSQVQGAVDGAFADLDLSELEAVDPEAAGRLRAQIEQMKSNAKANVAGSIDVTGVASESGFQGMIDEVKSLLSNMPELKIPDLSVEDDGILSAVTDMQTQLQIISTYAESMSGMMKNLSDVGEALNELKSGVSQLQSGSKQLTDGIKVYNQGIEQVYTGTVSLSEGTAALASAGGALSEGFDALAEGTEALHDGFQTFDEEGIQELTKLAGDDLRKVIVRVKALKKADEGYCNFAGIEEGAKGSVRFIIETEEI